MAYINNRKTSVGKRRFYCETQALALENFIGAIYRRSHLKVPIFPILIRSNHKTSYITCSQPTGGVLLGTVLVVTTPG